MAGLPELAADLAAAEATDFAACADMVIAIVVVRLIEWALCGQ